MPLLSLIQLDHAANEGSPIHSNNPIEQDSLLESPENLANFKQSGEAAASSRSEWLDESSAVDAFARKRPPAPENPGRKKTPIIMGLLTATSPARRTKLTAQLCQACENRNLFSIETILKQGASVNNYERGGKLPLACSIWANRFITVKSLVERGVDVNKAGKAGDREANNNLTIFRKPVDVAIDSDNEAMVECLI
ncbi:hypothetical protein MMC21_006765 [Puttea exsequens]|nr:hypothetical protein [Puttea exsequens]